MKNMFFSLKGFQARHLIKTQFWMIVWTAIKSVFTGQEESLHLMNKKDCKILTFYIGTKDIDGLARALELRDIKLQHPGYLLGKSVCFFYSK